MSSRRAILDDEEVYRRLKANERDFADLEIRRARFGKQGASGADFSRVRFTRPVLTGYFVDCQFTDTTFLRASSRFVRFERCSFVRASLAEAEIVQASFRDCDFTDCVLASARLDTVSFAFCEMRRVKFRFTRCESVRFESSAVTGVDISGSAFIDVDIASLVSDVRYDGAAGVTYDWRSIARSTHAPELRSLLMRIGTPEIFATYAIDAARAVNLNVFYREMRSTFISYGSPDTPFASLLTKRLQANGVRTFYFESDAIPGRRLHRVMRDGVNSYDRVILICSENSLKRAGVLNEIEETLAREARDGGAAYLIPVTLDDFIYRWEHPIAQTIRDRVIADFRGVKPERMAVEPAQAQRFREGVARLLEALSSS